MTLEDIEREWTRRKRGRRKERLVVAVAVLLFLGLIVVGACYALKDGVPT